MALHLLSMPREIRDHIYEYLLPGEEMALRNHYNLNDRMQSFMTLRAINQQIRAEVIATFNSMVPFSLEPLYKSLKLWGLPVERNKRLQLRRRDKRIINGKRGALLPWDVSKAKNFIVFDSSPWYHWRASKSEGYQRLISLLKRVERIAKLELRLYLHAGRDVYCVWLNGWGIHFVRSEEGVAAMDKIQAVIQEIGGLFKSELAGKVKDAKLTVGVGGGWTLSQDERKEILDQFADYRKEWERDMIHPSD